MNHQQLNELALHIDAKKGEIEKSDLENLCTAAQVDFNKTFRGVTELDGALVNRVLNLARNNAKRDEIKKANTVNIVGIEEYNASKLEKLIKATEPMETENQRYDRISTEMWKARKLTKGDK